MEKLFHSWYGWYVITLIFYCVIGIIDGIRASAKPNPSWLVWEQGTILLSRKPFADRRTPLMGVGFFVLILCWALLSLAFPLHIHWKPGANLLLNGLLAFSAVELGLFFLHRSGPEEIRLNGQQGTYERIEGWPWQPKLSTGSLAEFKGVCVTSPSKRVMLLLCSKSA